MKLRTLTLLATAVLCVGALLPETAWARTKGGYVSPGEADNNSIRPSGMQGSTKKRSTEYAAQGRDCGEAAQNEATNARYVGVGANLIPVPILGQVISGMASFYSIGAGNESTTKWKNCVRLDVKNGIAKIDGNMHVAVGKVEDNLRAEIITIAQDLHAAQQRYEQRLLMLELALASDQLMNKPGPTSMLLCPGCDLQVGNELPGLETVPEPEPVPPETPTADTLKEHPVSPSSTQEPKKEVVPPLPVRKELPKLLPGEQYAKRFSYTCFNGTC